MKINIGYIKVCILILVVGFLYSFSNIRNNNRMISEPSINFIGSDNLFMTHDNVSKLLIQNQEGFQNATKEIIDLNQLESALNSNPMVKKAEVFMLVNGELSAHVEQKRPIARVHTNASYYIDDEGSYMPLSKNYSARVPLVTGVVYKNKLHNAYEIAQAIDKDPFLKEHVIEIHQSSERDVVLRLRQYDFKVHMGDLGQLKKKINNFKAFYQKAIKDKTINSYSAVNLKFDSQVICTKK